MDSRIRLNVLGITFSQVQAGAYALVLAEENGSRRIPIIIGTPEAQSIAIFLEGLHPPRPLTHDLFISFAQALDAVLEEIFIYKFEEGIFYSELIFKYGEKTVKLDSRTSDAIALAIRNNSPIYTTEEIIQEAGIILEDEFSESFDAPATEKKESSTNLESMNLEELENNLNDAILKEDYEKASRIRDILKKRTNK